MSEEFIGDIYGELVVAEIYDASGTLVTTRCQLFTKEKYFNWENPNLCAEIKDIDGGVEITVTAESFAKAVEIDFKSADVVLSDNYFDITRGSVTVTAKTDLSADPAGHQPLYRLFPAGGFCGQLLYAAVCDHPGQQYGP